MDTEGHFNIHHPGSFPLSPKVNKDFNIQDLYESELSLLGLRIKRILKNFYRVSPDPKKHEIHNNPIHNPKQISSLYS